MGGLIKFIFIAIMVLWLIRLLIRAVLPMLFANVVNKMQQQGGNQQSQRRSKPEGSISIDYMPPKPSQNKTDKLGDFVEYEEIK
ncbi:DUF4834 family protein [Pedobacter sp. MW01-1-1]|uniref:DUF4834 family protein n=1 Tax=Pedobacter sp. MW01-1-1 TaxID=3383027 RepID=UPI003FEDEE53